MVKPRENPFRTTVLDAIPFQFEEGNIDELLERITTFRYRGAIVGPHGSGKSTLLKELVAGLRALGHRVICLQLHEGSDYQAELDALYKHNHDSIVCIDGAERGGRSVLRRIKKLSRYFEGIILTVHVPCFLPTLYECFPSPALFSLLLGEILGSDAAELVPLSVTLHRFHRGNLRDAFFEMYDLWSRGICLGEEVSACKYTP